MNALQLVTLHVCVKIDGDHMIYLWETVLIDKDWILLDSCTRQSFCNNKELVQDLVKWGNDDNLRLNTNTNIWWIDFDKKILFQMYPVKGIF